MSKVILNNEQQKIREIIEENLKLLRDDLSKNEIKWSEKEKIYSIMARSAHELHMSLDPKPKHHRYMIENRGMEATDQEFYHHIHPVEDLLKYLDDTEANNDPEDQTLDQEFKLEVYSRRWGHKDRYHIIRNKEGWYISFNCHRGNCDKAGNPTLYKILEHDFINYPHDLGGYIEFLWNQANENGLSYDEVQQALDIIGEWISNCEISTPDGMFREYN